MTHDKNNEAFEAIKQVLQADPICAANWHATIVSAAEAEGVERATANRTAQRFLKWYFEIDTADQ